MRHVLLALPIAATIAFSLSAEAQLPKKPEPKGVTEYSVEGQLSSYKQDANADWPELKGGKGGVAARVTHHTPSSILIAAEARLAYGKLDYKQADGTKQDFLAELRVLTGPRYGTAESHFTPYLGFGWRHVVGKTNGMQTLGANTVDQRTASYYYLPIGIESRMPFGAGQYIESVAEFDYLLRGAMKSELDGDTAKNVQHKGYGVRASAMFGFGSWAAGPFVHAWKINRSEPDYFCGSCGLGWTEPETKITEVGARVRYSFK